VRACAACDFVLVVGCGSCDCTLVVLAALAEKAGVEEEAAVFDGMMRGGARRRLEFDMMVGQETVERRERRD
jgi:hypothetical protein